MELTQAQIEKIEEYIAFEGQVELLHWEDTSQWGFKIKLGLTARVCLDWFDKTMKRSKKRGGQRYHCIFTGGEYERQIEALFCGRGWAETSGAHIALHVPDVDDQRWFRGFNTRDQGEKEDRGAEWGVLLLEVGEDEIIINQKRREKTDPPPVGGARSKAVAMMMQDQEFRVWLDQVSIHKLSQPEQESFIKSATGYYRSLEGIDLLVKSICGFKSKVELDNGNEQAWNLWERQFHRPFIQWCKRGDR